MENPIKIVEKIVSKHNLWKIHVFQAWSKIMGGLKNKVKIEQIEGDSIILGVKHPAWGQEISFFSSTIKKRINEEIKETRIKSIKIKVCASFYKKQRLFTPVFEKKLDETIKEDCMTISEHINLEAIKNNDLKNSMKMYYFLCKSKKKET